MGPALGQMQAPAPAPPMGHAFTPAMGTAMGPILTGPAGQAQTAPMFSSPPPKTAGLPPPVAPLPAFLTETEDQNATIPMLDEVLDDLPPLDMPPAPPSQPAPQI